MALDTVDDLIGTARTLLLDTVDSPYRYSTDSLVVGLNAALLEARRLRPDLFLANLNSVPQYSAGTTPVAVDQQYRMALVYYMAGHAHLRDEEETDDQRAAAFLNKFTAQMLTVAS